jgi:hypothetical protein
MQGGFVNLCHLLVTLGTEGQVVRGPFDNPLVGFFLGLALFVPLVASGTALVEMNILADQTLINPIGLVELFRRN